MYLVIELQTMGPGQTAHIVTTYDNPLEAESKWHAILSAAAISAVPVHAATILNENGAEVMHDYYAHGTEPEPELVE